MLDQPLTPATASSTSSDPAPAETEAGLIAVVSYPTYAQAVRAVDRLSDLGFVVQRDAIAGRVLTSVPQAPDRLTPWRAGAQSAVSGAVIGALFGWIFGPFSWISPLISGALLGVYGAVFGVLIGALTGVLTQALTGRRRDLPAGTNVRAERYDILIDASLARLVRQLLAPIDAPQPARPSAMVDRADPADRAR